MSDAKAHARLRLSLVLGSLYDLLFAVLTLVSPGAGSRWLAIPLPDDELYLRFTGIFLIILALFYLLPAIHPGRYLGNVVVAIVGRALGGAFLMAAVLWFGRPAAFLALAAGDILFALVHAVLLSSAEGGNPLRHYLR